MGSESYNPNKRWEVNMEISSSPFETAELLNSLLKLELAVARSNLTCVSDRGR